MDIDHIFIFTDNKGRIANELVSFGLTEGSSRVHQGQGTTNRTFSFENFFLEIVWVHNEQEIKSNLVKPTGLWQRAEFFKNNFSPFGLVIANTEESDRLFENAYKYQPEYFPQGMAFDIITNELQPSLPLTCRMPFQRQKNIESKPVKHKNKLNALTKATFQYCDTNDNKFLSHFKAEKTIHFVMSDRAWLTLTFDNGKQGLTRIFEPLQLTIEY